MSGSEQDLDFSVGTVPDSWQQASVEAPKGDHRRPSEPSPLRLLPTGRSADLASGFLTGLVVSMISGYSWYELATSGEFTTPWVAIGLGVAVGLAVRLGAGRPDPQARAIMALLLYLATWSIVIYGISRHLFTTLYGSSPSLVEYEREFLNSRLASAPAVVAWVGGALASVKVNYLLRQR